MGDFKRHDFFGRGLSVGKVKGEGNSLPRVRARERPESEFRGERISVLSMRHRIPLVDTFHT